MVMFEAEVRKISKQLSLPYPDRGNFETELLQDMSSFYDELIRSGMEPSRATETTLDKFSMPPEILADMQMVHMSKFEELTNRIPPRLRVICSDSIVGGTLSIFVYFLFTEVPMITFLSEGGIAVYAIIATAAVGLLSQIYRSFIFFVKKNHSDASLRMNDALPLYAASITFLVGVLGTAMGYYVVIGKWAVNALSEEHLRMGLYEPLPCLIVSAALASVIVVIQFFIQHRLQTIGVPHQFQASV